MASKDTAANVPAEETEEQLPLAERIKGWFQHDAPSWLISLSFHMVVLILIGLFMGKKVVEQVMGDAPVFESTKVEEPPETKIERFELGDDAPLDPTELTTESLTMSEPVGQAAQEAVYYDENPVFEERGGGIPTGSETGAGGLGFNIKATGLGPVLRGGGGLEAGKGEGTGFGRGGSGVGFGGRGQGHREALVGRYGGTKQTERAVAAALNWLARHQNRDGSWSMNHLNAKRCTDGTCTGPSNTDSNSGGTALGVLPFLAAGQTHQSSGPYQAVISKAIRWLLQHQKPDGDLSFGGHQMYAHGLATIALCEAFGMTNDYTVGRGAQAAIQFIETGQNERGGWRYQHGTPDGDTSVFGWEMMALKSGQMAGLSVNPAKFAAGRKWLDLVASKDGEGSQYGGQFAYQPSGRGTPCMSSVGLLITQYMGAARSDPAITGGVQYLMANSPKNEDRNVYYWYYATQVLHNVCGADWDTWNRQMRRLLVESQCKSGCATGSWDALAPNKDAWGHQGGRLMQTSLSALTLEIYYRYLPLYQLDKDKAEGAKKEPAPAAAGDAKPAAK